MYIVYRVIETYLTSEAKTKSYDGKRKTSDSVLWQKPSKRQNDSQKCQQILQLHNDCGPTKDSHPTGVIKPVCGIATSH